MFRDLFCSMAHHDGKATQIRHSVSLAVSLHMVFVFFLHGSCSAVLRQPTLSVRSPAAGIRLISCATPLGPILFLRHDDITTNLAGVQGSVSYTSVL